MKINELDSLQLKNKLCSKTFAFRIEPFSICVDSSAPLVARNLYNLYGDYQLIDHDSFIDFRVSVNKPDSFRRWFRSQVNFSFDEYKPFKPLPAEQAYAFFEWGLNWCVATNAHHYFLIHAAIVAKNDEAIILPGVPGAGKSTLCAALINRGWRLLSDEMTLISPETLEAIPVPRPVSLKNTSIDIIKAFAPDAVFGDIAYDTSKGTVTHIKPPSDSVKEAKTRCKIKAVIFPHYKHSVETQLTKKERSQTLIELADNSFNYHIHGLQGFELLKKIVSNADCYDFHYSDLNQAIDCFNSL